MADFIETTSPYVVCAVVFFALGAAAILYLDRNYKKHIQCATCRKKMFSVHQDDESSEDVFSQVERQNIEFMRHLVRSGRISDQL